MVYYVYRLASVDIVSLGIVCMRIVYMCTDYQCLFTGVTLYGSSESGPIETKEVNIALEEVSEYYKPGLPFTGKVEDLITLHEKKQWTLDNSKKTKTIHWKKKQWALDNTKKWFAVQQNLGFLM